MKKFVLGIISGLGMAGVGKILYDKGKVAGVKEVKTNFESMQRGIEIGEKHNENNEESE